MDGTGVIILMAILYPILWVFHCIDRRDDIKTAIDNYNHDNLSKGRYSLLFYEDEIEPFWKTLLKVWNFKCSKMVSNSTWTKIELFCKGD